MLWIAAGDGGSGGDPNGNGQNINAVLGKILRIDPSGDAFPTDPRRNYKIPPGNPYAARRRRARVVGARRAQPVALLVRSTDRRPVDRRRRPGHVRGGRLHLRGRARGAAGGRLQPRLEHLRGHCTTTAAATARRSRRASRMIEYAHDRPPAASRSPAATCTAATGCPVCTARICTRDFVSRRHLGVERRAAGRCRRWSRTSTNPSSFGEDRDGELYVMSFDGQHLQVRSDHRGARSSSRARSRRRVCSRTRRRSRRRRGWSSTR